ncbi:hypothetical protein FRC09_012544 [Ceratobasidium sp. 395]|nr:hypothetical protein FRC09_012544 [Ceratobasidium sp. 395]
MTSTSLASSVDDSSATPVTPDTTDTATKLSHSSSSRRLLKGTSAAVKIIGSAIGIPGVSEVREMAGQLILQTSNEHHAGIADLGAHLEAMLHIADPNHSLLECQLAESSCHLESMRRQVNEMQRNDRLLNAFRGREQIEALDRLSKQAAHLADRQILTHLRMQELATQARHLDLSGQLKSIVKATVQTQNPLMSPARVPAPEPADFPENKIPAIDLDMIERQEVELSYMVIDEKPCSESCHFVCALTHSKVRVTCTTGLLNGVRVMRKSYNSSNRATATQFVRRDLVSLSEYTHPNVASLKGIARDMHGQIREIVVTTAPMSQYRFLQSVNDPGAIARYMKGILELRMLERMSNSNTWGMRGGVQIQVNCNGHVTAIPAAGTDTSSWDWLIPVTTGLNPAAKDILEIFYDQPRTYDGPQGPPALRRFVDGVSHLQPGFTPLDVLKVAAGAAVSPSLSARSITTDKPPSTTFSAGEIMMMKNGRCVRVHEKQSRHIIPSYTHEPPILSPESGISVWTPQAGFQYLRPILKNPSSYTDGWHTSMLMLSDSGYALNWTEDPELEPWEVFRTKAKQLSQVHGTALHQLCQISPRREQLPPTTDVLGL